MTIWKLQERHHDETLVELNQADLLRAQKTCQVWQEHFEKIGQSAIQMPIEAEGNKTMLRIEQGELSQITDVIDRQLRTRYGCDD